MSSQWDQLWYKSTCNVIVQHEHFIGQAAFVSTLPFMMTMLLPALQGAAVTIILIIIVIFILIIITIIILIIITLIITIITLIILIMHNHSLLASYPASPNAKLLEINKFFGPRPLFYEFVNGNICGDLIWNENIVPHDISYFLIHKGNLLKPEK